MPYQWLNPSSLTPKTFAKPAAGTVSVSPVRETPVGIAFISLKSGVLAVSPHFTGGRTGPESLAPGEV